MHGELSVLSSTVPFIIESCASKKEVVKTKRINILRIEFTLRLICISLDQLESQQV